MKDITNKNEKDEFDKAAGLEFKKYRNNVGLSVVDVEVKTGISKYVLYNIEAGITQPSPDIIFALYSKYKCKYLDLFKAAKWKIPDTIGYTSSSLKKLNTKEEKVVKDIIELIRNNKYLYRALHD